ncbi:hypothetical protein ACU635_50670 [[Actinomadura] parvosata]|uniref:hypothetical protein n=1 Tax=[Actinomadura] parvosata TaxID=1955412 RepID=UPI00406C4E16
MGRVLTVVGLVVLVLGLVVGVLPVSARGTSCGAAFFPSDDARVADLTSALIADSRGATLDDLSPTENACRDLHSLVRIPAVGLLVVGAGLLVAGGVVRGRERRAGQAG